jgi:maltose O-acetyltransferase
VITTRTEKEKMLAGELYLAADPELVRERRAARVLLRRYNASTEDDDRTGLLRALLGVMGAGVYIEPPFYCDYGSQITLGRYVYMNFGCVVLDVCPVTIGNEVMFGPSVQVLTATHPLDATARCAGPELGRPITIGDRVWVGGGAILLPGITIGENSIIAAGAVVTRDVPPNVVVGGNPARVIRELKSAGEGPPQEKS